MRGNSRRCEAIEELAEDLHPPVKCRPRASDEYTIDTLAASGSEKHGNSMGRTLLAAARGKLNRAANLQRRAGWLAIVILLVSRVLTCSAAPPARSVLLTFENDSAHVTQTSRNWFDCVDEWRCDQFLKKRHAVLTDKPRIRLRGRIDTDFIG